MPEVAVIIPTYNRADYLPAAINSVLRQDFNDLEVVVIDDGSTDSTAEVVGQFGTVLRYVRQDNRGCAAARNKGVQLTDSRYLAFLDSDDLFSPRKLSVQSSLLDADPTAGFVYSDSIEFRVAAGKLRYFLLPAVAREAPENFASNHFLKLGVRPGSLLLRRELFEAVGGFDENMRYNEDSDFIQRFSIICRAVFSPYPTIMQRHHGDNKSGNRLRIYQALLASMEKILTLHPEFIQLVGEGAAKQRMDAIREIVRMLEEQPLGGGTQPGLLTRGSDRFKRLYVHHRRKLGNLILRREQTLFSRTIVKELASLIV